MDSKTQIKPKVDARKPVNRISYAMGDGIGPEIMEAVLSILDRAGCGLSLDEIKIGESVYRQGHLSGIAPDNWTTLRNNRIFLKAPITTPQGGGYKSLNVTIRKTMGLFANVRPVQAYVPFVPSHFPAMDLVVVRENEEDLYAGIEHQQTGEVVQCLKLVSVPGCERILRYAFEFARSQGRKKVTCLSKDNIMKLTDGLFHKLFQDIAEEYPDIQAEHKIIDIGAALLAAEPERFDVVVTLNLYGDIVSDITAQVAGSVGLAGSANIGQNFAMFEAIHGSAPDIAGKDMANPSGLLNAACMMLGHLGLNEQSAVIQNAWRKTLEDGIHTADIASGSHTRQQVGTQGFAQAVVQRIGERPRNLATVQPGVSKPIQLPAYVPTQVTKRLVGQDVFLHWNGADGIRDPQQLGHLLETHAGKALKLKMVTNRGVKVYPEGFPETFCTDHWRCRFVSTDSKLDAWGQSMIQAREVSFQDVLALQSRLNAAGLDIIKTENLYEINGERAYTLGQGE
ncbi:MAG: NADP-dependent isocitrate dehydrogenase [Bacteroidetes bacterium]|nr:NADP-dependent isocitrate dehydrogenase [Bacteroidota bacterium]